MEVKIKLKIKDVEIELSTEEAKELAGILQGLTREKEVNITYPYIGTWPYRYTPVVTPYWDTR